MANITFYKPRTLTFHKGRPTKTLPSKRFLAVELEISDCYSNSLELLKVVKKWGGSIVEDDSVPGGFEINSAPASGKAFIDQIEQISQELHNASAYVDENCGMHTHIDARDFDAHDIRRLLNIYNNIEIAIFAMVPGHRKRNKYAAPCAHKWRILQGDVPEPEVRRSIEDNLYLGFSGKVLESAKKNKRGAGNENRRVALNISSWFVYGTIECRLFGGSMNKSKIIKWSSMLASLLDYAKLHNDKYVREQIVESTDFSVQLENLFKVIGNNEKVKEFILQRISEFGLKQEKQFLQNLVKAA